MFRALEVPPDNIPTSGPSSPIQGLSRSVEDVPEKELQSSAPSISTRINVILRLNVAARIRLPAHDDVMPGAVMVDGPSASSPSVPSRDSGAIPAELVDDVLAVEVTQVGGARDQNGKRRSLSCTAVSLVLSVGVAIVAFVLIFVVGIDVVGKDGSGTPSEQQPTPTQTPPSSPSLEPTSLPSTAVPTTASFDETAWKTLIQSRSPFTTFEDATSPQQLALDWMLQDPLTLSLDDEERLIQRFALAVLYFATGGPTSWKPGDGSWVVSTNECDWRGRHYDVACKRTTVVEVDLYNDGLTGRLPREIGLLSALRRLDLFFNEISGTIPTELGLLSALTHLSLSGNSLEGTIPSELCLLTSLSSLTGFDNKLEGTIPTKLGLLSSLTKLSFYGNHFRGSIPTQVGLWTSLEALALWTNDLSGAIPSEIGQLTGLTSLGFSGNNFRGPIPTELGLVTNLTFRLSFHDNPKLTGRVPLEIANLINLNGLYLYDTALSGSIPSSLCGTLRQVQIDCGEIECDCCTSSAGSLC